MSDIVKATELKLTIDQNNPFQMPLRQIMQIQVTHALTCLRLVKMIGCRYVCNHICRRNYSFSLRQNISNLCQSIFAFLTVYYDKIFKR